MSSEEHQSETPARPRRSPWLVTIVLAVVLVVAVGIGFGSDQGWFGPNAGQHPVATATHSTSSTSPSPRVSNSTSSLALPPTGRPSSSPLQPSQPSSEALTRARQTLATMSLEQKVGQVMMVSVGSTGADQASRYALDSLHIGNVFLKGKTQEGTQSVSEVVNSVSSGPQDSSTAGVRRFVATDQEGGVVQLLGGTGFSQIPSALLQGQMTASQLKASAAGWGSELARAGVNVNLAPVLDTVPSAAFAPQNTPIGAYSREYGYSPEEVSIKGNSVAQGLQSSAVAPAVKHFPGLGRVTANTDTSTNVTDAQTVRNDAYLKPFKDAIDQGVRWVMVSNAYYPKIDESAYAPFSSTVMRGMLRDDLSFNGIIISDDICDAVQVSVVPASERAADFIAAGGTMALCTNQTKVTALYQGVVDKARADSSFSQLVDAAALKVLEIKAQSGLLT